MIADSIAFNHHLLNAVFFIPVFGNLKERRGTILDYVIKNHKELYIRLNQNGTAVTCAEHNKTLFEYSKAKNILDCLPKTLKRLNFKVVAIPDIKIKTADAKKPIEKKVIKTEDYTPPDSIMQWVEKFGICDDILKEAQYRKDELNMLQSNIDKEFVNLIHELEFEGKADMYKAWKERNKIKENREKRRKIKDELSIVSEVLKRDLRFLDRQTINNAVVKLAKRKFTYRIVEEETECCVEDA